MKLRRIKISDLGSIITGNTPPRKEPDFYGSAYPFIKPTDIEHDTRFTFSPEECYSEKGFRKYKNSLIPKGSTCVVTIGSIGKKITMASTDCFINQAMNAVIPNESYDPYYVFYLLKQNLQKVKASDSGTSSGRENVSKSAFGGIEVDVIVDKNSQPPVGRILSAYDDLIENNLKRIQLLEEAARCRYRLLMESSYETETVNLKALAEANSETLKSNFAGEILYIDIASVEVGKINNKTPYQFKDAPGRARRIVKHGDTIWSCVRPNRKSYSIIWEPEENLIASTGFAVIRPKKYTALLYHALTTVEYVNFLESQATGAAYPAVTAKDFENSHLVIPSDENMILEFESSVEPMFSQIKILMKQNALLREARDILLPRLMSGDIDVASISEPEPTIETLEAV